MERRVVKILYEDNHLLVAVKEPYILSQSDGSKTPDMLTILKQYLKLKYNKPGNVYLGLVHRLDKEVGGVMVFAKTSKAASRLSEQIRLHKKEMDDIASRQVTHYDIFQKNRIKRNPYDSRR